MAIVFAAVLAAADLLAILINPLVVFMATVAFFAVLPIASETNIHQIADAMKHILEKYQQGKTEKLEK